VEKFFVVGRPDLSESLKERVLLLESLTDQDHVCTDLLESSVANRQSVIESLAIIRILSRDPINNLFRENLEPDNRNLLPQLTWEDIIRDDPLTGEHWQLNVESDDDELSEGSIEQSPIQELAASCLDYESAIAKHNSSAGNDADYDKDEDSLLPHISTLHKAAYWTNNSQNVISEADVLRESILAVLGFPSVLFTVVEDQFGTVVPASTPFVVDHLSQQSLDSTIRQLAQLAVVMAHLRQFSQLYFMTHKYPNFNYRFILGVLAELTTNLQASVLEVEDDLLNNPDSCVSITRATQELRRRVDPFRAIVAVMKVVCMDTRDTQIALLDVLYDRVNDSGIQIASWEVLTEIFLKILQDYFSGLVMPWITEGKLPEKGTFFIQQHGGSELWGKQYGTTDQGPTCLKKYADTILSAGRAAGLLATLGHSEPTVLNHKPCSLELIGSTALLDAVLDDFFNKVDQWNNRMLYEILTTKYRLKEALLSCFDVYFMMSQNPGYCEFLSAYFARLDKGLKLTRHLLMDDLEELWHGDPPFTVALVEGSQLRIKVPISSPLRTVLTPEIMGKYESVWSLLVHCARVHHKLVYRLDGQHSKARFICLNLVTTVMVYLHESVLRGKCRKFSKRLQESDLTFQELVDLHGQHVDDVYECCLMSSPNTYAKLVDVLELAMQLDAMNDETANSFYKAYAEFKEDLKHYHNESLQALVDLM
jgi:hypothetical protein